jgi:hypothetical protein
MAQRQIVMHCECGHSKTWTHECPSVIIPMPMPTEPPEEPGAASPKSGGIR